jgi:L-lactate dehydrogenase complex protein LldG
MNDARSRVLGQIKAALDRGGVARTSVAELDRRVRNPQSNLTPGRARLPPAELTDLFVQMAEEASATVARVSSAEEVPTAVLDYLRGQNLPAKVVMAPDLNRIDWSKAPLIEIRRGAAVPDDVVSVTGAFAGVAETGTLMMASGREHPTTLNILPETHVVVLGCDQILSTYEDAWTRLREARRQEGGEWSMPRTVNFITGPSRSADIEQKLQMGAHGPRRVHIIIVNSGLGHGGDR